MRKFKTAEENRTNYIYYFDDGSKCVITPGENGENTTIIAQLHAMDDDELDAQRREEYHCPIRFNSYHDGDGDDADDRNPYLEDDTYNPLQQIFTSIAEDERFTRMAKLKVALSELTDKQKDNCIYQCQMLPIIGGIPVVRSICASMVLILQYQCIVWI